MIQLDWKLDMCVGDMLKSLNPMTPNVSYTHHTVWCSERISSAIVDSKGGVRSTQGLGPTMTARGQSIGISIAMLPQTFWGDMEAITV